MMKGTAAPIPGTPVIFPCTTVCATPIPRPARRATGKDLKEATNATEVAARTRLVMTVGCSVTVGAMKIANTPARPLPIAQLIRAMRFGESPRDAATVSFSAIAVVLSPKRV